MTTHHTINILSMPVDVPAKNLLMKVKRRSSYGLVLVKNPHISQKVLGKQTLELWIVGTYKSRIQTDDTLLQITHLAEKV